MTLTRQTRSDRARLARATAVSRDVLVSAGQYVLVGLSHLGMSFYPEANLLIAFGSSRGADRRTPAVGPEPAAHIQRVIGLQPAPRGRAALGAVTVEDLVG